MRPATSLVATSALASICTAARLFVSSYDGYITTLDVVNGTHGLSLAWLNATDGCAPRPSWLELDKNTNTLYCTDEGATDQSTISSYKIEKDGSLTQHSKITTPAGGVSSTVYNDGRALAIAHYGTSFTSISLAQTYNLSIIENIFVPALATDQVHWFSIDLTTSKLNHTDHITLAPGSGPRHGVFYLPPGGENGMVAYYYVVPEKTNMIHGYEIQYDANYTVLGYKSVYNNTIFADVVPPNTYAGEVQLTPDNKYLILSSRNDSAGQLPNLANETVKTDSLVTFSILKDGAALQSLHHSSSGGDYPRHFSLNQKGDLVAVANQKSHKISLFRRDLTTGKFEIGVVAEIVVDGEVTCVIWDEADYNEEKDGNGADPKPVDSSSVPEMPATTLVTDPKPVDSYSVPEMPATTLVTSSDSALPTEAVDPDIVIIGEDGPDLKAPETF